MAVKRGGIEVERYDWGKDGGGMDVDGEGCIALDICDAGVEGGGTVADRGCWIAIDGGIKGGETDVDRGVWMAVDRCDVGIVCRGMAVVRG